MTVLPVILLLASVPSTDTNIPVGQKSTADQNQIDPDYCDPNIAENCAYPLGAGEKAPFTGTLLTPALAIDLGQKADNCDRGRIIQLERDVDDAEIDVTNCQEHYDEQSRAITKMGLIAQDAADECDRRLRSCEPAFYERWWFGAILGVVVGGGVVGFAVTR